MEHLRLAKQTVTSAPAKPVCPVIFKASFDKANRTSHRSFRGPGIEDGLKMLSDIRAEFGVPVTTDVHETADVEMVGKLQKLTSSRCGLPLPAKRPGGGLRRVGHPTSIKKGQFLAPWDCRSLIDKFPLCRRRDLVLIERGTTFGYNNLVSDFRFAADAPRHGRAGDLRRHPFGAIAPGCRR